MRRHTRALTAEGGAMELVQQEPEQTSLTPLMYSCSASAGQWMAVLLELLVKKFGSCMHPI